MVEEKEAIERLYNMKNKVDVALMNSKREKGDWLYDDVQGTADTLRMAINALKKQIPKKPFVYSSKYGLINAYYCPVCNHYIRTITTRREVILAENIFCGVCGQKLDWSDE